MQYRVYVCHGPTCAARGSALLRLLESQVWMCGLAEQVEVSSGACLGRCEEGPNLVIYPGPVYYTGLTKEAIQAIVKGHLSNGPAIE